MDRLWQSASLLCQWTFFFFFVFTRIGCVLVPLPARLAHLKLVLVASSHRILAVAESLLPFDLQIQYLGNKTPCRSAERLSCTFWQIFNTTFFPGMVFPPWPRCPFSGRRLSSFFTRCLLYYIHMRTLHLWSLLFMIFQVAADEITSSSFGERISARLTWPTKTQLWPIAFSIVCDWQAIDFRRRSAQWRPPIFKKK